MKSSGWAEQAKLRQQEHEREQRALQGRSSKESIFEGSSQSRNRRSESRAGIHCFDRLACYASRVAKLPHSRLDDICGLVMAAIAGHKETD